MEEPAEGDGHEAKLDDTADGIILDWEFIDRWAVLLIEHQEAGLRNSTVEGVL